MDMRIKINYENKKIQDIKIGDYVVSFDINNDRFRHNVVTNTHLPIVKRENQIELIMEDGTHFITSDIHPMCYLNDNKWDYKPTGEIIIGEFAKSENGTIIKIVNIKKGNEIDSELDEQFYDISVANDNNYIAGYDNKKAVVHNSSTTHFPWWHREILDVLVLKNNKGTDDNRVRKMDYSIQLNRILYKRFVQDGDITLFSPNDVPDLFEAFYKSNDEFESLYEKYERSRSLTTKKIKARELFNSLLQERIGTGRIYIMNIDHVNDHSSLIDPVYMSNLCQEISLNTSPINHIDDGKNIQRIIKVKSDKVDEYLEYLRYNDLYTNEGKSKLFEKTLSKQKDLIKIVTTSDKEEGYDYFTENVEMVYGDKPAEIALCVLAAINLGEIKELGELEDICEYTVRSLDFVIENQDYPVEAAKKMLKRRSLGVGITNLAYFLAKNDLSYEDPKALVLLDEVMEHIQYYLIKASVKLAKEYGPCKYFKKTKYAKGILPIDTYNKNVDIIVNRKYTLDWESLRQDVLTYGMRNSTLSAIMPCESSSLVSNSTNGIEPIRSLVVSKKSKQGVIRQVAPEMNKLKNKYQLAFNMTSNKGITNVQAVIQKWIDQSISGNHYYDITKYKDGNISLAETATDLLYAYKMGIKNLYYANTYDNKTDKFDFDKKEEKLEVIEMVEEGEDCIGGSCSI